MGLVTDRKPARELFKPYTKEEKEVLAKKYTAEQIRAIEAGEQAIDPEDLDSHGVIRTDLGALPYLDDLSQIQPVVDKRVREYRPIDPNERWMTDSELGKQLADWYFPLHKSNPPEPADPEDPEYVKSLRPNRLDVMKMLDDLTSRMGSDGPASRSASSFAPGLPKQFLDDDNRTRKKDAGQGAEEEDPRDRDGVYTKLRKQTGLTLDEILDFKAKILVRHRVVNQTRLGKIASIYCLAVAGNGNGRLGIGEAKGTESEETMNNARIAAIRNMKPIPRYEERTIFGDVEGKVAAAEVKLMTRPPGFGLRCQHNIFEMARAAGIHDLAARVPRSRNKMNTIKATYQALMSQRIPDEIARGRGKKLVDVRKVYYGGHV